MSEINDDNIPDLESVNQEDSSSDESDQNDETNHINNEDSEMINYFLKAIKGDLVPMLIMANYYNYAKEDTVDEQSP
jgi:hypothetical protein